MVKFDSQAANLRALKIFPEWMDINKRPSKSKGGIYLSALTKEIDDIGAAFEDFKSGFFLKRFAGKENDILSIVYIAQVGNLKTLPKVKNKIVTDDAHVFLADTDNCILYQDNYLILSPASVDQDNLVIEYEYNGFGHSADLKEETLWNIFDEFAMFCGISRHPKETNEQLVNRIYAVFKKPTSSTETGLKNAIINAVMNYDNLLPEDIIMEQPNQDNMFLEYKDGEVVYNNLSAINKDTARQKIWDTSYWENSFKKLEYIPNKWDAELPVYQKGVGQLNDLQARISDSLAANDTTGISIMGYKASPITINEYIKKQGVSKDISLGLAKYKDELVERNIEYKIIASQAEEIDPRKISVKSKQHIDGYTKYYLEDIVIDPGAVTEEKRGYIETDTPYTLEFTAPDKYSNMKIEQCDIVYNDNSRKSLLTETGAFKFVGNSLQNIDVKAHIDSVRQAEQSSNMTDTPGGGITLDVNGTVGTMAIDVSHMQGMPVVTSIKCEQSNYTDNHNFVKTTGSFHLEDTKNIISTEKDSDSSIVIEMDCASIQYELTTAPDAIEQGSVSISFEIDGEIDVDKSGFFTQPQIFSYDFQNNHHVKITIVKAGMNPVCIRNIMAASYNVFWSVDHGQLIKTPQYVKLPTLAKNRLRLKVESLSPYPPVIQYIHIGPALTKAVYQIKDFVIKKLGRLNITTNCKVRLLKGQEEISNDYSTKTIYRNDTKHNAAIIIDTNSFINIKQSNKNIDYVSYHGIKQGVITLTPGESLSSIDIFGELLIDKASHSLADVLEIGKDEKLYIAGNAKHFISLSNGTTKLLKIDRSKLPADATNFTIDGISNDMQAVFVLDEEKNIENETAELVDSSFEYAYIRTMNAKEYIAYNNVTMLQSPVDNVPIVNTFSPSINLNTLLFYKIKDVHTADTIARASFSCNVNNKQEFRDWALGSNHNGIHIEYDFAFGNTEAYKIDLDSFSKTFALANNIKLEKVYEKDGKQFELARYLITPPEDMHITYQLEAAQENLTITEDGFNKLWYANVSNIISISINDEIISSDKYRLVKDAGIIAWNGLKDKIGEKASIAYEFSRPVSIEFNDLSSLYELVGYSIDAYEPMMDKPWIVNGLYDGDSYTVEINGQTPDRVIVQTTNENFYTVIDNNARITVHQHNNAVNTLVHSGYYYDGSKEYYYFENDHIESVGQINNIDMDNIQKNSGSISGIQGSGNYIKDTVLSNGDHYEKLCDIDCVYHKDKIEGISKLKAITACDSYEQWIDFNMDISLVDGYNNLGIQFHSNNIGAYALLNISSNIEEGSILSFYADASLHTYIMREIYADDDSMRKSTYCEKIGECEINGKYRTYKFENIDDRRIYLCVAGDGIIDDIIIHNDPSASDNIHSKAIKQFGFNIQEVVPKQLEVPVNFNAEGNTFSGLELDNTGCLQTGSSVDWGVTKIVDFTSSFEKFICYKTDQRKNSFYTSGERGTIQSPWIYISDVDSVDKLYIKINDVLIGNLKNFDVHIKTAEDVSGRNAREIAFIKKTNLVAFTASSLSSYLQIVVEMPPERVINSIEIYARYVEKEDQRLHVTENNEGSMTSKIYDLVTPSSYKLTRIDAKSVAHPENIEVMIRGLRQDSSHGVWTDWYPCYLDANLICTDSHVFYDYRYFQFKINISDMDANININNFVFEVV